MTKEYKLEIEKRKSTKKSDLKKYRKDNKIPGVYYSYDSKESINFLVSQSEINMALKSDANIFAINVGGENKNVLLFTILAISLNLLLISKFFLFSTFWKRFEE